MHPGKSGTWLALTLCGASVALTSCGGSDEPVTPTPRSEFRSSYPCEVMTKAMAASLLGIEDLRRVGAQTLGDGIEQCIWARGRYKAIPQVQMTIFASGDLYGQAFTTLQRNNERNQRELRSYLKPGQKPVASYRTLRGLGDRAFMASLGRVGSEVAVSQGGKAFLLTLRLKQKPRSQPPPIDELIAMARTVATTMARRPK